jgi:hypothetical protein
MTSCMTTAYNHVNKDGKHRVYWIHVPQHRGHHQGYVGRSKLNEIGLGLRYGIEISEAFNPSAVRNKRRVHTFMKRYQESVFIETIAEGLTKEEAKKLEKELRPKDNKSEDFDKYNWNEKKGG